MTDRPIIFSAPMVRALLEGRKTQTRRVLCQFDPDRDQPHEGPYFAGHKAATWSDREGTPWRYPGAKGAATGDRLYVREAFSYETLDVECNGFMPPWYWADGNPDSGDFTRPKPSIHMPRWASRLTLTVTDVRVQRLQEISRQDALAEGMASHGPNRPQDDFRDLWNSLHGPGAWAANPWVVALTFTVQHGNIDQLAVRP